MAQVRNQSNCSFVIIELKRIWAVGKEGEVQDQHGKFRL
jgi:hypothetical protein